MHTRHVEYLLPDYVNGKLEQPLRGVVVSHLTECAECKVELEILQRAFQVIADSSLEAPSAAYFSGILPRVREQLEERERLSVFARPLFTRFALPLAAGALVLVLLLHVPVSVNNGETGQNPLGPLLTGVGSEELVEIALDQMDRQSLSIPLGEGETSALFAAPFLSGEYFLSDMASPSALEDPVLGDGIADDLEALSDADLDVLVARLSERTSL